MSKVLLTTDDISALGKFLLKHKPELLATAGAGVGTGMAVAEESNRALDVAEDNGFEPMFTKRAAGYAGAGLVAGIAATNPKMVIAAVKKLAKRYS